MHKQIFGVHPALAIYGKSTIEREMGVGKLLVGNAPSRENGLLDPGFDVRDRLKTKIGVYLRPGEVLIQLYRRARAGSPPKIGYFPQNRAFSG